MLKLGFFFLFFAQHVEIHPEVLSKQVQWCYRITAFPAHEMPETKTCSFMATVKTEQEQGLAVSQIPQILTRSVTCKTHPCCSLVFLISKDEGSFRLRGRTEVACTSTPPLPRNQGQGLYPFTALFHNLNKSSVVSVYHCV